MTRLRRSPLPASLRDLAFQAGDVLLQIIEPEQEGVHPARIRLPAPLPAMDQQAQVARGQRVWKQNRPDPARWLWRLIRFLGFLG